MGLGSVFTNDTLVRAALTVMEPLYRGENALEPERVSEKLHQNTFWLGRGGSITHAISGIDESLWSRLSGLAPRPLRADRARSIAPGPSSCAGPSKPMCSPAHAVKAQASRVQDRLGPFAGATPH